jgi:hypothetical protein
MNGRLQLSGQSPLDDIARRLRRYVSSHLPTLVGPTVTPSK